MTFVVAAGAVVGGIGSGLLGYFGATSAANTQAAAEQQALAVQQQQFQQAQKNLSPFINVGTGAVNQLGGLFGIGPNGQPTGQPANYSAFTNSPDYAFALSQGNAALQNYLNANGMAGSGSGITAAINYNQGLATQQYGNYFSRLMQIATLGGNAAGQGANLASNAAGTMGNTIGNIGASQASGIVGGANALAGGLNSGVNNALLYNAINRGQINPSGYANPNAPTNPFQGAAFNTVGGNAAAPVQYTGTPFQAG